MLIALTYHDAQDVERWIRSTAPSELRVITPGPKMADEFRSFLQAIGQVSWTVDTYAHWLRQSLGDEGKAVMSKRQSLLLGAGLWRKTGRELDTSRFQQAYHYYTELRSSTVDATVLTSLIDCYDEELRDDLSVFRALFEHSGQVDEQLALSKLSTSSGIPELWSGFELLSGTQIDSLVRRSSNRDLYVLVPWHVWEHCTELDWPKWVHWDQSINLAKHSVDLVKTYVYPSVEFGRVISESGPFDEILLISSELNWESSFECASLDPSFAISIDPLQLWSERLRSRMRPGMALSSIYECMFGFWNEMKRSFDRFHGLKVIQLWKEILEEYQGLADNGVFEYFDLYICNQLVELAMPRVWIGPNRERNQARLRPLKEHFYIPPSARVLAYHHAGHGVPSTSEHPQRVELEKELVQLGPLKRVTFSRLMDQAKLLSLSGLEKYLVLADVADQEVDFFKGVCRFETSEVASLTTQGRAAYVERPDALRFLSASRVQSLVDCPRRFALLDTELRTSSLTTPYSFERGIIEHQAIERVVLTGHSVESVVEEEWQRFVLEGEKKLSELERSYSRADSIRRVHNGIEFLKRWKGEWVFSRRKLIEGAPEIRLEMDALLESDNGAIIVDFKRSSAGVPSKKEFLDMNSVQLWFYAYYGLELTRYDWIQMVYCNLDEPDQSFEHTVEKNSEGVFTDLVSFSEKMSEHIREFGQFGGRALPRAKKVCQYCPHKVSCVPGVSDV